ncbi:MAG: YdcF family protein [Anaerolineae bacterium]|nr:YdcF family protein [Anaerolineae bacterium]
MNRTSKTESVSASKKRWKKARRAFFAAVVFAVILFATPRLITGLLSAGKIHRHIDDVEQAPVAIVFGAGLTRQGTVTRVLKDRVDAAATLYNAGKVEKLLMSGDNRFVEYNEPGAMYAYATSIGIPAEDIVLDYAGRRTYDTCYRAQKIFGVSRAILVTQRFHLPRALFTCRQLGMDAEGFDASLTYYLKRSRLIWNTRELPATLVALVEVWFTRPLPVLGNPEPIQFESN